MNLPLQLTTYSPKPKTVNYIPINTIRPNPYQPRRHFDCKALDELALSIKSYGVLQPISVRKQTGGTYELVAGERRLRASKLAGLETIPAIVVDFCETDSAMVALLENLQREDLSFMEEALSYSHLINQHHLTQEEVARKVGKSQSSIANKLRLLKLGPLVKKILSDNNLTERHARALLRIEDEQLQLNILTQVCEKNLNVVQTEALVEEKLNGTKATASQKKPNFFMGHNNVRVIVNTIKQSIKMIKDAGMEAGLREYNGGDYIEYTIRIKKCTDEPSLASPL